MPSLESLKAAYEIESAIVEHLEQHLVAHPDSTGRNLYSVGHQASSARAAALARMIDRAEGN